MQPLPAPPSLPAILAKLEPAEAEMLRHYLPAHVSLTLRDDAIRAARPLYDFGRKARAAGQLAADLHEYLARGWLRERHQLQLPPTADSRRVLLHQVARFNDGETLRMRQILNVWDGHRGS